MDKQTPEKLTEKEKFIWKGLLTIFLSLVLLISASYYIQYNKGIWMVQKTLGSLDYTQAGKIAKKETTQVNWGGQDQIVLTYDGDQAYNFLYKKLQENQWDCVKVGGSSRYKFWSCSDAQKVKANLIVSEIEENKFATELTLTRF